MSKMELLAKIELLNKYEAMMEELKTEADRVRDSIKAEMEAREVEELIAGQYIVRYTSVLSNRFQCKFRPNGVVFSLWAVYVFRFKRCGSFG